MEKQGCGPNGLVVDYKDGAGKRRFQTFKLKRETEAALVDITGELRDGTHTPVNKSITVAQAGEIWFERGITRGHERATMRNYRDHLDRHINPLIGGIKLAKLSTPMVASFADKLERQFARARARKILVCLKGILKEAQRRGLVAQNVALPVQIDSKSRDRRKL